MSVGPDGFRARVVLRDHTVQARPETARSASFIAS
jgi:hypothetical protein